VPPKPTRILIVDDEPTLRMVLGKCLGASGFSVQEAQSGEDALAAVRQRSFDLVLLDLQMPGMGGLQACREISGIAPRTGIVVMSVRDGENDMVDALGAGADDYVAKPFRFRELVARLGAVLRRVQRQYAAHAPALRAGDIKIERRPVVLQAGGELIQWPQGSLR